MSSYSHRSRSLELRGSGNYVTAGISSTPGDQRDTGSGHSQIIKIIPDPTLSPIGRKDNNGTIWEYRFHCSGIIGKGGFGVVYLGTRVYYKPDKGGDGKNYAIKELKYSSKETETCQIKRVLDMENQVCINLKELNNTDTEFNIVKPQVVVIDDQSHIGYIVTEFCSGGDLSQYLKRECPGERVTELQAKNIMAQVTKGVNFLHKRNFIHRDIKPENVLRHKRPNESEYIYKIADFGLATKHDNNHDLRTTCGTRRFMAPEMDGNTLYGPEVDVWSLGVLFFSLLVGKHSQVDATKEETYRPIKKDLSKSPLYPADLYISTGTQVLVNNMLKKDPRLRLGLNQIEHSLSHPIETNYKSPSTTNRTMSDSGIASSCTSGSTGPNGSRAGIFGHMNSYPQDRNVLPGFLQSVAEEQPAMVSGIENCRYTNRMSPRTNFVRSSSNEPLSSNNTPLRPPRTNSPYRHQLEGILPNFSPQVQCRQQYPSTLSNDNLANDMQSTTTVGSSYRGKEMGGLKPPPLTTVRLRPSTKEHKTKQATYSIMQNGSVKMELNIEKKARQNREPSIIAVKETIVISEDGHKIEVKREGGLFSESKFSYDNLPKNYWPKYSKAAAVVNSVKASTAKITWTTNQATCKLMENGNISTQSEANFEVEFACGIKFEYDSIKHIVTVSERTESRSTFRVREKFDSQRVDLLKPEYGNQWELFQKYHVRIKAIDKHFEELQTKDLCSFDDMKDFSYFPLRLGPNKLQSTSSSSMIMPSSYSNVNTDNNENRNVYANRNRASSTSELKRTPLNDHWHMPVDQMIGRHNLMLPHTRSSPNMQGYRSLH